MFIMRYLLITLLVALVEILVFWISKKSFKCQNRIVSLLLAAIYWAVPLLMLSLLIVVAVTLKDSVEPWQWNLMEAVMAMFVVFSVAKCICALFAIPLEIVMAVMKRKSEVWRKKVRIVVSTVALSIALIHCFVAIMGITHGRFDYTLRHEIVNSADIPEAFDGYKILHVSDLHLGSFIGHEEMLNKAFDFIIEQDADVVAFTGDIVNIQSDEAAHFLPEIKRLASSVNFFAVLGNHDYEGHSISSSKNDLRQEIIDLYRQTDTKLLLNESVYLHNGNDSILLIGVENIGKPPFPSRGNVDEALSGKSLDSIFSVLLSHDPSHWEAEVRDSFDIDLTLSGHTHGMQYAIGTDKHKISPVSLVYHYWMGLYKENDKFLNVSTGIGYVGFPGRINMKPEICVIELRREQ